MTTRRIFFRADAGEQIGYGHFIRTLALAEMLKKDFDCHFFTQTPTEYQKREVAKVCALVELPGDDTKFETFINLLDGNEIVVLDNYFFTTDYQRQIKAKGSLLVCIDDMHDKHYVADVVINQGCDRPEVFSVEPYTRLCLGLEWALLRKPFLEVANSNFHKAPSKEIKKVVVCFGGSDTLHLTDKAIRKIAQDVGVIDAIVGTQYQCRLTDEEQQKVNFHRNISAGEVADLFRHCDLAIVSASTVCIEALACGANVAAGWYVDNQQYFYEMLTHRHYVLPWGDLRENEIQWPIKPGHQEVPEFDGLGAKYIHLFQVLQIEDFEEDSYQFINYIRLPENNHKEIWEVRNLPEIRVCMVQSEAFSFESHLRFVASLKTSLAKIYWAVFHKNHFVASISLHPIEWEKGIAEWGIYLHPDFTGKGTALSVSRILFEFLAGQSSLKTIQASVKNDNQRSIAFHHKAGFIDVCQKDGYVFMNYEL